MQQLSGAVTYIIPILIAIFGWFVAHWLSSIRERSQKIKDLRLQYMTDAYRNLSYLMSKGISTEDDKLKFKSAIDDIMLFGNDKQIELLRKELPDGGPLKKFKAGYLMIQIRNDLRRELNLSQDEKSYGVRYRWSVDKSETERPDV